MAKTTKNISQTVIIPKNSHEKYLRLDIPESYPLNKANIINAGVSRLQSGYEIIRNQPPSHVVLFITAGHLNYEDNNGNTKTVKAGERLTLPAGYYEHYWSDDYFEMFWFHLRDSTDWTDLTARGCEKRKITLLRQLDHSVREYIDESDQVENTDDSLSEEYARLISKYLQRELKGYKTHERPNPKEEELNRLLREVESDLSTDWTVKKLASLIYASESQLHRLCREIFNTSPMQLVRERRLARAHEILINTDYPLEVIAEIVGYETPFALSKAFKATYSLSPSHLRKLSQ